MPDCKTRYLYIFSLIDVNRSYQDYLDRMCREGFRVHTCEFSGDPAITHARILWEREITTEEK